MLIPHGRLAWISLMTLLAVPLSTSPASASFIANWDVVPIASVPPIPPPPSPLYECPFWTAGGLRCEWLWDQGLEVSSLTFLGMLGDGGPFVDAFGTSPPLASNLDGGVLGIVAHCRTGLSPCVSTFTPTNIFVDLFSQVGFAGVFFKSSKGGLVMAPGGLQSVNLAGAEWTDITSMSVGIFLPDACGDPNSGLDCKQEELILDLHSLTFDATQVPEPASIMLLGAGLLEIVRRRRRR